MAKRQTVALFANSGCDMPPEKAEELGFTLIPDIIIYGDAQYQNNIDINNEEFYQKLKTAKNLPTSSHPSIGAFMSYFEGAGDCEQILCMTVTARMSGTWSTGVMAKQLLEEQGFETPVFIHNTQQVSHGMGLMMREASAMAREGLDAETIMLRLDEMQKNIGVYFVLESLKNARKGGRVGAIKALAADALGIKPLLTFADGTVRDIGVAKNFKEGIEGVLSHYRNEADFAEECIVFHADNLPEAKRLAERIKEISPGREPDIEYVGSVIGIYTGSGCVGVAFKKKK